MKSPLKPVLLIIRDGWGKNPHADQNAFNAVYLAKKACDDALQAKYPRALVAASATTPPGGENFAALVSRLINT